MLSLFRLSKAFIRIRPRLGHKPAGRRIARLVGLFTACLFLSVAVFGDIQTIGSRIGQQVNTSLAIAQRYSQHLSDLPIEESSNQAENRISETRPDQQTQTDTLDKKNHRVQLVSYNKIEQIQLERKLGGYRQKQQQVVEAITGISSRDADDGDSPYINKVERSIERAGNKRWIESGRKLKGSAQIQFDIQHNGKIANLNLLTSSGNLLVDQQLLASVQQAAPFPPVPLTLQQPGEEAIRLTRWLSFVIESGK